MNRYIGINDFLHSIADACDIRLLNLATDIQFAVIASTDRSAYNQLSLRKEVFYSLCQYKEQRSGISAHATGIVQTQEINVLVVIEAVVHTLRLVVDMGTNRSVWHFESCCPEHLEECTSKRHRYGLADILATDANHSDILLSAFLVCRTAIHHVSCL